jgi:hypothetical protein
MWRALGGLSAIAVLLVCATTPEPVHRVEREKYEPPYGDNFPEPTPVRLSGTVASNAQQNCGVSGDAGARHGTVEVVVRRRPEGRPLIDTQKSGDLNEDDRTCVASEASQAVESLLQEWGPEALWGYLGNRVTFSVSLYTAPPPPPVPPPEF